MRVRHGALSGCVLRRPLPGTGGALHELPVEAEQILEVIVVPLDGVGGPGTLQPAGDRVDALATAEAVLPAEALLLDACAFGLQTDELGVARAMHLAERVSASDEGDGFLVIHRHAGERFPECPGPRPSGSGLLFGPSGLT